MLAEQNPNTKGQEKSNNIAGLSPMTATYMLQRVHDWPRQYKEPLFLKHHFYLQRKTIYQE